MFTVSKMHTFKAYDECILFGRCFFKYISGEGHCEATTDVVATEIFHRLWKHIIHYSIHESSRLCGLVVRVSDYSSRRPGFDSWPYQIF
jgi:hypothetical protein